MTSQTQDYQPQVNALFARLYDNFRPPPELTLDEWAERYARLSPESSAEPGAWTSIPYQVGIMQAFTDPEVERITLMKSARVGYTKILNHYIGYTMHLDPCNMLVVQPTLEDADGYSKDELSTMLRDTPCLQNVVSDPKSRDGSNTIRKKNFKGGVLYLVGANSPRGFRRISAKRVLFDEVDGYPPSAGTEGDQIKLGERRSEFFFDRKIVQGSTPLIKGESRIDDSFAHSDQRYYWVPCPHCHNYQILKWSGIVWPKGKPELAHYECEHCHDSIDHSLKQWMVERGEWRASEPFTGHAGFHIWAGYSYSPNAAWGKLAKEWTEAQADTEKLQVFVNTVLGECYEETAEKIAWQPLYARREEYETPAGGALVVTMGVDVQKGWLAVDVQGWAKHNENWQIEYFVIEGEETDPLVWRDLRAVLERTYLNDYGQALQISATCVDSGYQTDIVYDFCNKHAARRVFATKGEAGAGRPIVDRMQKRKRGKSGVAVRRFIVGVDGAKTIIYHHLQNSEPGPGYRHFSTDLESDYFEGLTAEKRVTKKRRGFEVPEWHKIRPRNEPLDTAVLNLAALRILNPTWETLAQAATSRPATPDAKPDAPRRSRSSFDRRGGSGFDRR